MPRLRLYFPTLALALYIFLCTTSLALAKPMTDAGIKSIATKLTNAVLHRDEAALIKLSRPEDLFEGKLAPNTRQFIFDVPKSGEHESIELSVYEILRNSKKINYLVEKFQGTWNGKKHKFARVYFYDPTQIKLQLPIKEECNEFWMKKFVTCLLVEENGKWLVAYTLFDSETDGPL